MSAVELVTIGTELLLGETVDTNGAWLARRLAGAGVRVVRRVSVGDDAEAIRDAVATALERTGRVICTGGLGPTGDDITRPVVADLLGRPLDVDTEALERMRERFRRRGLEMADRNRRQAQVPRGAEVLPNSHGTAPGLLLEAGADRWVVLLPGVPHEMRAIVDEELLPRLRVRVPDLGPGIRSRMLRTTGIAESTLAERVADIVSDAAPLTVAFLPSFAGTDIRVTSWGELDDVAAEAAVDALVGALRRRVGDHAYAVGETDLAEVVAKRMTDAGLTLALAESCTGGLLGKRLTDVPGASLFLAGGVVAYSNHVKQAVLRVPADVLARDGAVSEASACAMAAGARRALDADAALAITGIAGPDGGTAEKPVGTVWIAAALGERTETRRFLFPGSRDEVRQRSAQAALEALLRMLTAEVA
ncbi:MAG TPA: competence/damage-inducible protein A [Longimicrobiales bacterium]|nr:competence/damage-inducible protein A [Longimicrobiales bacterium]